MPGQETEGQTAAHCVAGLAAGSLLSSLSASCAHMRLSTVGCSSPATTLLRLGSETTLLPYFSCDLS